MSMSGYSYEYLVDFFLLPNPPTACGKFWFIFSELPITDKIARREWILRVCG